MNEKRFTHKKWLDGRQLFDGDEPFAIVDVYIQAEAIVNLLNGLDGTIKDLSDDYQRLMRENKELKRENLNIMSDLDYYRAKSGSCEEGLFQKDREISKLKLQNEELLYQIGEMGKNNKTCRECECFISEINYCYMWDMEVKEDDVVVACDQRKVKKTQRNF